MRIAHWLLYTAVPVAVFAALLPLVQRVPVAHALMHRPQQNDALEHLWIDLRIGPPLITLFNDVAREDDIARIDHYSQIGQLSPISKGHKMVIVRSIAEAEQALSTITGEIDVIGYNLEHSPGTPGSEQDDPVGSVAAMRELADTHGVKLAFGPDHDFALSHGVAIAPYVDLFVLQIQRQQTNPPLVEAFVVPLVPQLRQANPDLEISVQVRTEGDVAAIVELLATLNDKVALDGVSILTSPETVDVAHELVFALRPEGSPSPPPVQTNAVFLPVILEGD